MQKHEEILYKILTTTDKKLKKQFKKFYDRLEELIELGYTDRVILKHVDKEVAILVRALNATVSTSITTALTASIVKNKELFPNYDFERIKVKLSDDIWNTKENLKEPIKNALKEGKPARELAKEIVGEVNTYAKGQGVCKEPIKNAMRVARNEITTAYREQDNVSWGKIDFVIGKEIRLSNSPKKHARCEICRNMTGSYPKLFEFRGFHVQCLCYQIPIMLSDEDFEKWELGELKELPKIELPKHAVNFVNANRFRFESWKTPPYWLNNFNKKK